MSLSFNENKDNSKSYIKLEIHQSQVCQNIKVPFPYGLCILFGHFPEKYIEPISNANEIMTSPKNQFIYHLNDSTLSQEDLLEKEFIINSYTTSIFIIKKNFASVKIPILYSNENSQKQWFFLKDINDNICIKLLIKIEIHLNNKIKNNCKLNYANNILKVKSETIKENKINNINKSNSNNTNSNIHQKNSNKNIANNYNTYLGSTNFNSLSGNSLINLSNNIIMKTTSTNSNLNNNNLAINFPFNFSPIPVFRKNNSFFIDIMREKSQFDSHITENLAHKNSIKSIDTNKLIKIKNEEDDQLKLITENDCDSITINDNDIGSEDLFNNEMGTDKNNEKEKLLQKVNKLISMKNDEIFQNQQIYSTNYNNYLKTKKNLTKYVNILEKESQKIKNKIKNIEKSKQIYETKNLNLNEAMVNFSKNINKYEIQKELEEHERMTMMNLNNIFFQFNNFEQLSNQTNINNINEIKKSSNINKKEKEKGKDKKNSSIVKKSKLFGLENSNKIDLSSFKNPIYIKKLNLPNKKIEKRNNDLNSHRKINKFNKKYSPINYKLKEFNTKLSLSISNSDNLNEENNNSKNYIELNNKNIKSYVNKTYNNNKYKKNNNKKYNNIFKDYYYDNLDKEYKKKPSKSNLIKGNIKIKIPFNENTSNTLENYSNYQSQYIIIKNNLTKETLTTKTNSINTSNNNNISNKSISLNKTKTKLLNKITKANKIKSGKYLFNDKYRTNTYKRTNTSVDRNIFIENKSSSSTINSKPSFDKKNILSKNKLNKKENEQKSINNEKFKNFHNYNNNYFKGKPILICNNNNCISDSISSKIKYNNTENNESKKNASVTSMDILPSKNILACGYYDGVVEVWDLKDKRLRKRLLPSLTNHNSEILALKFLNCKAKIELISSDCSGLVNMTSLSEGIFKFMKSYELNADINVLIDYQQPIFVLEVLKFTEEEREMSFLKKNK